MPSVRLSERGESLIELVVALALLGLGVVAVVGGLGASSVAADSTRKETSAAVEVKNFAEALENYVSSSASAYVPCATISTAAYLNAYTATTGYTRSITSVHTWTGSAWSSSCATSTEIGLQKLTLLARSNDGRGRETIEVVLRKPCAPGQGCT
jgi:Tfp pilus assembly protein PilV